MLGHICALCLKQMDGILAELNQSLDEKRSEEARLMEDLAKENMKEFTKTSSTSQEETSLAHNTQSLAQPSRPRASSSPVEGKNQWYDLPCITLCAIHGNLISVQILGS